MSFYDRINFEEEVLLWTIYRQQKWDIIQKIDGYNVEGSLDYILQNYKVGDILNFDIIRNNKETEIKVELK